MLNPSTAAAADSSPSADSISSFGLPLSSPESLKSEVRKSDEREKENLRNQNEQQQRPHNPQSAKNEPNSQNGSSSSTADKTQPSPRLAPPTAATPAAASATNAVAADDLFSVMEKVDVNLREVSESRQGRRKPYKDNKQTAKDRLMLPHLSPIEITAELEGLIPDSAKNVYLFVNPSSGGNAAASFMEAGMERIRLTVQQPVNLWIWDIRQGKSGDKPGFKKLRQTVEGLKHQMRNEQRNSPSGRQTPGGSSPRYTPESGTFSPFASPVPLPGKTKSVSGESSDSNGNKNGDEGQAADHNLVYVIVAGGDGTVMWCIMELWAHGIDDELIVIGVVPYGTGNKWQ